MHEERLEVPDLYDPGLVRVFGFVSEASVHSERKNELHVLCWVNDLLHKDRAHMDIVLALDLVVLDQKKELLQLAINHLSAYAKEVHLQLDESDDLLVLNYKVARIR